MKIQLNKSLRGYLKGKIICFDDVHLDKYWVKRIKDSEYDNCVSIISESDKKSPSPVKPTKKLRSKNGD